MQCSTALPAGEMRFENRLDELVIQGEGGEMNINRIAQCNERSLENVNSTECGIPQLKKNLYILKLLIIIRPV